MLINDFKWAALAITALLCVSSCSRFSPNNEELEGAEQKVFATHMRSLCSTIENFNDLLKKTPDSLAWAGYGIIIKDKITIFENACASDPLMESELKQEFSQAIKSAEPFAAEPIEKKMEAQKKLMEMSRMWLKKYQL